VTIFEAVLRLSAQQPNPSAPAASGIPGADSEKSRTVISGFQVNLVGRAVLRFSTVRKQSLVSKPWRKQDFKVLDEQTCSAGTSRYFSRQS